MLNRLSIIGLIVLGLCSCQGVRGPHVFPTATTPNPTETMTPIPTPGFLSEQLGFSDKVIQELQETHKDCHVTMQRETQSRTYHCIAYLIACSDWVGDTHLLVYEIEARGAEIPTYRLLLRISGMTSFNCTTEQVENWQDIDRNGLPDLIFCSGNNYYWFTYVFLMTYEGKMENLLDVCPLNILDPGIKGFSSVTDLKDDGVLEFVVTDTRWAYNKDDLGLKMPSISRVYILDNCEYQEVSSSYPEPYEQTINHFFNSYNYVMSGGIPRRSTIFLAFDGLFACDIVGRREECWPLFWELTDLERHPLDTMQPGPPPWPTLDASDLEFIEWLYEKRVILEREYEAGLPFNPEAP